MAMAADIADPNFRLVLTPNIGTVKKSVSG